MEQLDYNLLFRWFVGLNMDDPIWDATVFSKNRERLLKGDSGASLFRAGAEAGPAEGSAQRRALHGGWDADRSLGGTEELSEERCAVWTPPPDDPGNPTVDFHGEKRSNQTHQSKTDPEARLYKKGPGKEAKLSYQGQVLMENRNGLVTETRLTPGHRDGRAGSRRGDGRSRFPGASSRRVTVGADKAYDTQDFVAETASN